MDLIPLCIAIFLFLISTCGGTDDRIIPGKPLSPGSTVVSGGGAFALGFFSPASSNATLYVGIWYNNIPVRTVLWVANRNSPIADPSSAFLALTDRSDLVVSDSVGGTLWTTDNNITGVTGAAAVLLDSGNLVIQSRNGTAVWQSFDHPTGTIIPGMKIWLRRAVHASIDPIVAWKGPDDPSAGDFSLGSDSKALPQLFIWHGSHPYWRSSLWNGPLVTGQYNGTFGSILYQALVIAGSNVYMKFDTSDSSLRTRGVLDNSGNVQVLSWGKGLSSGWTVLFTISFRGCDRYGTCGPFGYCDATEAVPTCKCLEGFDPVSGNISQGCRRNVALECGGGGELFLSLPGMKVPDKYLYFGNVSFDKCTALCSSNCSCTAYTYNNLTDRATSRCLLWMGELIDTGKLVNSGESLYLRIASSGAGSKRKSNALEIVLLVPASFLTLICVCLVWIRTCRGRTSAKQRCKKFWERKMPGDLGVSDALGDGKLEFPFLRFREIAVATNNFADSNMLGRGGFGNVYKGMLEGGTEIAVKRLSRSSGQGIVEFRNEVILIAKLQHRSLVKLLGCCIHGDEKLLIYEYLPNKSLDAFLFNDARKSVLDWPTRFKIIKGVARGLLYLHQDSRLTIIHRDLKASNILLDADMSPKISDFGMARIFGSDQQHENTNRVVGTYGYMSPEYALEGAFSVKSDVYSFGVLLLEIVSGIKISSTHQLFTDFPNLKAYAWSMWNDGNAKHLVDSLILESCSLDEVLRCIHVGLLCVQDDPNDRPLMSSSVFILENGATALPAPKQPIYYAQRNHGSDKVGENIEHTVNDMSLTGLEGR